jgi:hypothetical protein
MNKGVHRDHRQTTLPIRYGINKSLKIPETTSEAVHQKTDNTMARRIGKRTNNV